MIATSTDYYADAPTLAKVSEAAHTYWATFELLMLASDSERAAAFDRYREVSRQWREAVAEEAWRQNDAKPLDLDEAAQRARMPLVILIRDMVAAGVLPNPVSWVKSVSVAYEVRSPSRRFELL